MASQLLFTKGLNQGVTFQPKRQQRISFGHSACDSYFLCTFHALTFFINIVTLHEGYCSYSSVTRMTVKTHRSETVELGPGNSSLSTCLSASHLSEPPCRIPLLEESLPLSRKSSGRLLAYLANHPLFLFSIWTNTVIHQSPLRQ